MAIIAEKSFTEQFDAWFEAEKKNGLVDLKFFTGQLNESTVESFSREALAIIHSPKTPCSSQEL